MTPLIKSLVGIGLAEGATGLSVGGYYLLKPSEPKTLEEKFKKERIIVLNYEATADSTDDGWNDKLTKYKDSSSTNKFTDLTIGGDSDGNGLQNLKNKCKEHLKKSLEEIKKVEGLETQVKTWCTKSSS